MATPDNQASDIDRLLEKYEFEISDYSDVSYEQAVNNVKSNLQDIIRRERLAEHKILMANIGAEYASALHGLGKKKDYDPDLIIKAIENRGDRIMGTMMVGYRMWQCKHGRWVMTADSDNPCDICRSKADE